MAGLQEMARKTKTADEEIERAKVSSSCGSSFRSISPVRTSDDSLTKVSGWMDKTEEVENVALSNNVSPGYQQTCVSAPVITVQTTHGGQFSEQVRGLKSSVQPTISTEAIVRDNGRDRPKTVVGAGSQKATAQPQVKFATSKPSRTLMAGQSWVPSTNGGNPSSAFQVPQFANRQPQCLSSQGPTFGLKCKSCLLHQI